MRITGEAASDIQDQCRTGRTPAAQGRQGGTVGVLQRWRGVMRDR